MANQRHRRLMQEALDERLSTQSRQELFEEMDRDPDTAAEYHRLRQVDRLLRTAPLEHAPRNLALHIMARLAEGLQQPQLSHISGLALALALVLVTAILTPILIGLAALFLSAVGSAAALTGLIQAVVGLLTLTAAAMEGLVKSAQLLLAEYPQTPALILGLIPVGAIMFGRLRGSRSVSEAS